MSVSARDGKEERRERRRVREARKSNLSTRNFKQATGQLGGRKRVTQGHNSSHPLLSPQARVEIHKFPLNKT